MYSKMLNERENSPTLLTAPEWIFVKEEYQESWQHTALWACVWDGGWGVERRTEPKTKQEMKAHLARMATGLKDMRANGKSS